MTLKIINKSKNPLQRYESAQAAGAGPDMGAGAGPDMGAGASAADDDVVDADFKEV